jgi:type I restriction enzyme R subunit
VNLVTEKDKEGRVYVSTYPTMMGLIDETKNDEARFGVGYFDLIIIDEAHRSVYQKYSAIFRYFDSFLVGLTATPRDQVDRNTYELFDLEPGVPTDAYELSTAVTDGFLVPPKVKQVDLKFPREGIDYDSLSDEEKTQWESLDWGDDGDLGEMPDKVNATAINSWLFNKDTVDKMLQYLMENGHKVEGGDKLGKTIIFARNHEHAFFIEERFNHHYPHYKGHFARIIDNYAKYPQSLIDDFSMKEKLPQIAISVDMLDTGIDVPEVVNLVFFKPVYSKIKFWQMIGRGTRLCQNLYGPGENKQDFRVFDFCFNFDYFKENPEGIEANGGVSLSTRLFRTRVQLLSQLQTNPDLDLNDVLKKALISGLHHEVVAMNRENFIVRMRLEAVERFQEREVWDQLREADFQSLQRDVSDLPSELETDDIESRQFDLTVFYMQLAHVKGETGQFERYRERVVETSILLEEKTTIPAVRVQLEYLSSIQESSFWDHVDLNMLEELRLRLRNLMPFLDKKKRKIIYTDFKDEIMMVREEEAIYMPKMTGAQYEKKVKDYLRNHQNHIVIHRLRSNEPLTETDLNGLEKTLVEIGNEEGKALLTGLLERNNAPSLAYFVRSLVGLDRAAVKSLFAEYLSDRSLTSQQIRFIEMVVDQLTARGIMEASALYEPPFSNVHHGGPDGLFIGRNNVIDGIFDKLNVVNTGIFVQEG